MKSRMTHMPLLTQAALAALAFVALGATNVMAQQPIPERTNANYGAPFAFNNYYAGSDPSAAMYPSPRPTPPAVGHTYITYPPFAPHQYLYTHGHRYVRHNPRCGGCGVCGLGAQGGGKTVTTVSWGHRWYPFRTRNDEFPFFNLNEALPR